MKTRLGIFLIMVALIAGMVGCGGGVEYDLTITSTAGGSVTTPGEDTYTYDEGEVVNLVAEAEEGYHFVNWTGDVDSVDDVSAASTTVTMNGDYSITAEFIKQYDLAISSTTGGSVTVPGEATYAYDEGKVVNLVARAEDGYHFVDWTGDVSTIADVNAAMTSIAMDSNYIITANFAVDLYFETDAYLSLSGPATLPPEERDPCVILTIMTNVVMDSVRVDLPDGRSVIVPEDAGVVGSGVDQTTGFRFTTCAPGMPTAGGEYRFTAVDAGGEPIPGVANTDIWVGVEPPAPPTDVRAEVTNDGMLISWDESPIVPGSFEPAAVPQLGSYHLEIHNSKTGTMVYGAAGVSAASHLIARERADFIEGIDQGLSLSEIEDGDYELRACVHSFAPEGSLGYRFEYFNTDPSQNIIFTIKDGKITLE